MDAAVGDRYHLAADGISLVLVLFTGVAAMTGVLFSWNIENRAKEFFASLPGADWRGLRCFPELRFFSAVRFL